MTIDRNLKPHEFRQWLADAASVFQRTIELEVNAFPTDEGARATRMAAVHEPATGFGFFCRTYFPHYQTKPNSQLHDELEELIPNMLHDPNGRREGVIGPRGSAKSTKITLQAICFVIALKLKHYPVIIQDAFEQAALSIEAIKAELEVNPRLMQDFPDACGQGRVWREGHIVTKNNIRIEGFGVGKKIRGRRHGPYRPDFVVMDDIENDENVESPKQRQKLARWIDKAVLKLGPTDGTMDVLFAGTVIHFDAVIVQFSKRPNWNFHEFRAIQRWPDDMELWEAWEEVYRNEGEPAADAFYAKHKSRLDAGAILNWPASHSLLFLMKERAASHESFASEYQNQPISEGNGFQKLTYWAQSKTNLIRFGAIDPSLGKKGAGRDPSAILIGGYDPLHGILDVLHASIRRRLPDLIISDAIALQKEYECVLWFVETVQFQEFLRTELMKSAAKNNIALPALPVNPIADKVLRIERLQPPVAAGLIRFHNSQTTLIEQLQQFPLADHDDGPDCLEMLHSNALKYGKGGSADLGGIRGSMPSGNDGLSDYRLGAP